jgi:hypothetical protein
MVLLPKLRNNFFIKDVIMLEDFKEPISELKQNILDVWGRL